MMNKLEFAKKAVDIASNYKTLYVMGGFGGSLHSKGKIRAYKNSYNTAPDRKEKIEAADENTFGFDCVGLVKTIIWGWCGDTNPAYSYGGASVNYKVCPDVGADSCIENYCYDVSKDFSFMDVGEFVWMSGHCGIYVGDGLVVESTPKWKDGVQITACANIREISGFESRKWTKHGKLPWIDYSVAQIYGKAKVIYSNTGIEPEGCRTVVYEDKDVTVLK